MARLVPLLFATAAAINLIPIVGAFSAGRLEALYGFPVEHANLEIVLRHRAVTIALVGALLAAAVVRPTLRRVASVLGLTSMSTFVAFVALVGDANAALLRVLYVDLVGIGALLMATILERRRIA
ncbi:MAG: phosphopantetheine adenylyltransferase [bacterium]|nr:phosphopantetheine adenylyltransferase [bacterium]